MNKIKRYIEEITSTTGSSTFCILPWIHVATRPNGDMRLCCSSNASGAQTRDYKVGLIKHNNGTVANFSNAGVLESFNNEYMCNIRTSMLHNVIPASCTKCFEEEANGVASKRIWEYQQWSKEIDVNQLISDTSIDGKIPPVIRYLDLRLGHTCNLKCIMCTPHDSSSWVKENAQLVQTIKSPLVLEQIKWNKFDNFWYEKEEFWQELFAQISNISHIYFAGGEPLMIKEHQRLLDKIIELGYANKISLRYNSNVLYVTDEIINVWSKFKQVRYACSIDAIYDRNHYIRYPTNWNEIEEKLDKLDAAPQSIQCSIACTVQALNIKHLPDFVKWKLSKNYKNINNFKIDDVLVGGGLINLHLLYIPSFLSARILPKEDKIEVRHIFEEFKKWLWNNYTQDDDFWVNNPQGWARWDAILKFIEGDDQTHMLPAFIEYINNVNQLRAIDSKIIFPELAHLM